MRNQTIWETWFICSIIVFATYFFVGTLDGSKDMFPNWLPFFLISIINLITCLYIGSKKS